VKEDKDEEDEEEDEEDEKDEAEWTMSLQPVARTIRNGRRSEWRSWTGRRVVSTDRIIPG